MAERSKILIIGATGYLGKYIVQASLRFKHPTFVLVREHNISSNPEKAILVEEFRKSGVIVFFGDVNDHESLLRAIKQVDVVFSLMGHHSDKQLEDQIKIVSAITEAGNIKRYFPSEFGFDVDRLQILEPAKGRLAIKARVRETIRKAGIPFTFVSSNFCATYFLSRLGQVEATGIPKEIVHIIGDGNTKVIFVDEDDIACGICAAAAAGSTAISLLKANDENQCVYTIYVRTGSILKAGTDSIISIDLFDRDGNGIRIPNLETWGGLMGDNYNYFERGNLDIFSGRGPCLSLTPCSINVTSDGSGAYHGWYCNYIELTVTGPHLPCDQQLFTIEQWLATDASPYKLFAAVDVCPPAEDIAVAAAGGGGHGRRGLPDHEA